MAENGLQPERNMPKGAIDLMYFPSGGDRGTSACNKAADQAVALKKECGLECVFVTKCKSWSCDRRIYCDVACQDDILRYTLPYPDHFIGLAGYNPLDIAASLNDAERGICNYGFRGIYVHPGNFGITPVDRRMYPLYLKSVEWDVPVILDVRQLPALDNVVRALDLERLETDFGGLNVVVAQSQWTTAEMLHLVENVATVYFCFDTPALLTPAVQGVLNSPEGQTRCMWGSNGLSWKEALGKLKALEGPWFSALLRDNAVQLFGLDRLPVRTPMPFVETEQPPMQFAE